jgi:uncharacterized protein
VILVDTGPFVALFDPKDHLHHHCFSIFDALQEPLSSTVPVLTEAFHMLGPGTIGARRLQEFVLSGGVEIWFMDPPALKRAFSLMERYADHPMDMADASLIVAAEVLQTRRIFTVDHNDFFTYRIQRGHRYETVEVIG